ncbi:MAG: alpha/beta hydrolase [Pseudomonadota bacterium]
MLSLIRKIFALIERLSPRLAARLAVFLASRPRKHERKPRELEQLQSAERIEFTGSRGRRCVAWAWGEGPTVIVAHGWESRGSQMATMAMAIAEAGFRAVAIDFAAHGDSEGRSVSFVDMGNDTLALARQLGEIEAFVGHSAGGVLSMAARERGFHAKRYCTIGSPTAPYPAVNGIRKILRPTEATLEACRAEFARGFGASWDEVAAGRAFSNPQGELLLIFDRDDGEVDHHQAELIAGVWPGAKVIKTEGLGHRRLMWHPTVIEAVVAFLKEGSETTEAAV